VTVRQREGEPETAAAQIEHLRKVADVAGVSVGEFVLPAAADIIANGIRLHYLDWGNPTLPPVVFLHGGGQTAHTWDIVCLALREERHCVAVDLRGHGDSEWSSRVDYSLGSYATDVEQLIAQLGPQRPVLVGMSLGGLAALTYAARSSAEVGGLVIVDVGPAPQATGSSRIREFMSSTQELDSVDEFVERALAHNPTRDPRLLKTSLRNNLHQLPNGRWTWKYDRRHRDRDDLEAVFTAERTDLWSLLPAITAPVLILRGARSDVFHDEDAEELVRRLPAARWARVENAGHSIQGENPKGLINELRRFFAELETA
jgi:pimeloyl-ACP methyl ester carboxylesterase